jgi:hypothetical protein
MGQRVGVEVSFRPQARVQLADRLTHSEHTRGDGQSVSGFSGTTSSDFGLRRSIHDDVFTR